MFQSLSFQNDHQIIGTGDQIYASYLRIIINTLCDGIKSLSTHRSDTHFDQSGYFLIGNLFPVDQCVITADDLFLFHLCDLIHDRYFIAAK